MTELQKQCDSLLFDEFDPSDEYELRQFTERVHFGEASITDAEKFMRHFCALVRDGKTPGQTELGFIAEAFDSYLNRAVPLPKALGVTRGSAGRAPNAAVEKRWKRAALAAIKHHVLKGSTKTAALDVAASEVALERTQMKKAWRQWKKLAAFELVELIDHGKVAASRPARARLVRFIKSMPNDVVMMRIVFHRRVWYPHMRKAG
jgi:hypothetical protein